ncbi:excinuclease ABC subunit C [Mycoplasma capricolum subsp. capripneumoniae]|uniref:excinuclease ABC subunit UvrC n=1 Tax=Mycoplasma capricolum TaxID=2095 RepID=UPI0004E7F1EF|nr:excinuclease ABC subunit UvrC [Mycoplasma capricolum]QIN47064.1 excinuclease ABC subunit C [Mycoplasma capricolum subsp. capripneumoniae]QIN48442.1 excinuclease ABC subunit C [Mycoplasma capricolum subsp. capripneumoniae]QIN49127.1 excinuclease ABC subunit C [Mycoplasma capricolum subsp. capripneumoniae]QIN49815.1 excinuclease ABC subunit C [Mycoplasma capricolum subsp. capripneumoniae]CDZ18103.1 UvrABC system protein C [Mycoplasma capricolum subsp. capripneumoniae]
MSLKEQVDLLTNKPGCYLFLNKDNEVIYVGKAKNLKKRVSTYFNKAYNIKTTRLIREITHLKYFIVDNEKESLLLEKNLIKKYRPKYNVLLNDDKAYPYIIITNQKDPMYKYVRKYEKKALKNYGPLPIGSNARSILLTLQRLFPLRMCKGDLKKPCLYYHLNQCSGACFKTVDSSYYEYQIKQVDKFFKGEINQVKQTLVKQMQKASDNLQFEQAKRIKDQITSLDFITAKQNVDIVTNKNIDVVNYEINEEKICFVMLFYRLGQLTYKDEYIQNYEGQDLDELLNSYLQQIYQKNLYPDVLLIPNEIDLLDLDENLLEFSSYSFNNQDDIFIKLAKQNAVDSLNKSIISNNVNSGDELEILDQLQQISNISKYPKRIEIFDISNIYNQFITGACIVYINAKPVRNEFRKYNIDSQYTSDYARMKFMLEKRFLKRIKEKEQLPDLIIVDGGIIQIHAAKEVLNKLNLKINVIGLSKDNNHKTRYLIDIFEQTIDIKNFKKLYNFLTSLQIRVDEYAKSGFRKKYHNQLNDQILLIKGVGKKTNLKLYKHFKTIDIIKNASFDELNKIINNKKITNLIISNFKK